jgi:hypothetical protein
VLLLSYIYKTSLIMQKTLLFSCILCLSTVLNAQDVCGELMQLSSAKKNLTREYRMTSKTAAMGQTLVMEHAKDGNVHQTISMEMGGQKVKIESIIIGTMMYMKKNDEDWTSNPLDSAQIASIKSQWENGQLQFFKNCKKLDNQTIEGKTYRLYSGEFDAEAMKKMMSSGSTPMPNADMYSKMEMNFIFYVNAKDDVEKTTLKMSMMGQTFDSEMTYEYDVPVAVVCPPSVKKN